LILSLYIYIPPRRLLDFVELYYDNDQKINFSKVIPFDKSFAIPQNDLPIPTDTKNYYVCYENKGYLIFNNYKTKKTYSTQYFEIDPKLNLILQEYINQNKIDSGNKIMSLSRHCFSINLELIFECYANKKVSASILRHSYITHLINNRNIDVIETKKKLSYYMAHTAAEQQKYYREVNEEEIITEINPLGGKKLCKVELTQEEKIKRIKDRERERYLKRKECTIEK